MRPSVLAYNALITSLRRLILTAEILILAGICGFLLVSDVHRARTRATGDFEHFYYAADAVRQGIDPYAAWSRGYIYPPLIAFVFQPLSFLGRDRAAMMMLAINVAITLLAVALAANEFLRRFRAPRDAITVAGIMILAMLLNCDKIKGEWQMWQTDVFMLLLFVLSLRWLGRRPILAGMALGIAFNIKYLPLLFLPYLLLRRRWKVSASLLAAAVFFALLPAVSTGWSANVRNWRTAINGLVQMTDVSKPATEAAEVHDVRDSLSCSITSAIARNVVSDPRLGFALAAIAALGCLLLAGWMYNHHHIPLLNRPTDGSAQDEALTGIEWVMLVAAVLVFSPQTNTRHLFDVLILTAAASVLITFSRSGQRVLLGGMAVLFLGFTLPPGSRTYTGGRTWTVIWIRAGGPCICLLIAAFSLLWSGLSASSHEPRAK